jgi:hypothetical protein
VQQIISIFLNSDNLVSFEASKVSFVQSVIKPTINYFETAVALEMIIRKFFSKTKDTFQFFRFNKNLDMISICFVEKKIWHAFAFCSISCLKFSSSLEMTCWLALVQHFSAFRYKISFFCSFQSFVQHLLLAYLGVTTTHSGFSLKTDQATKLLIFHWWVSIHVDTLGFNCG